MITTIIAFVLIIGFLVLVHEIGHFLVAKKAKMAVEEFGIGFPPAVYQKKINETVYSLNAIPIGGYVKIKGEDGTKTDEEDSFSARPIWQRMSVIVAGVFMNILAGCALFIALYSINAPVELTDDINEKYILDRQIIISEIIDGSPAHKSGLKLGDELLMVNSMEIDSVNEFQEVIESSEESEVNIKIARNNKTQKLKIKPEIIEKISNERPLIGVGLSKMGHVRFPPHKAVVWGVKSSAQYLERIGLAFWGILKGVFAGNGVGNLGGPVAIAVMTNDVIELGLGRVILFTSMLSFNLAILNILPFPALDGGRFIFLAIEAVRGKPSNQEVEEWFHRVGFILLILLAIFITYKDLIRFGGRIWHRVIG